MKKKPLVSVITTVWNSDKYIRESVVSILEQTFDNFEYIIVNDGSTDRTSQILEELSKDKRIRLTTFSTNIGRVAALNNALEDATGEFIALQDGDDISHPKRLEVQTEFMTGNPEYVITGTDIEEIDPTGRHLCYPVKPTDDSDLNFFILFKCTLTNPTTMFRRNEAEKINLRYQPVYAHAEDFAFISELLRQGKVYNIPQVLLKYRRHPANNSKVNFDELSESSINIAMRNVAKLGIDLDRHTVERIRALLSSKGISGTHVLSDVSSLLDVIELYLDEYGEGNFPHIKKLLGRMPNWLGRKNLLIKPSYKKVLRRIRFLENRMQQSRKSQTSE